MKCWAFWPSSTITCVCPSIFVLFAGTEKHTTRIVSIRFPCLINSFFLYLQSGRFPSRSHQFHDPWPISSWELKQRKKPCTSGFQVDFGILVSMDDSPHRKMNHQSEINSNNTTWEDSLTILRIIRSPNATFQTGDAVGESSPRYPLSIQNPEVSQVLFQWNYVKMSFRVPSGIFFTTIL